MTSWSSVTSEGEILITPSASGSVGSREDTQATEERKISAGSSIRKTSTAELEGEQEEAGNGNEEDLKRLSRTSIATVTFGPV